MTLRGTIDLLVRWRDGSIDVIDYKRARAASVDAHALQLDAYALAARSLFPGTTRIRTGIVFLGGAGEEPVWRRAETSIDAEADVAQRIASLGAQLVEARWSERFPRAPVTICRTIRCGYVRHCHPEDVS